MPIQAQNTIMTVSSEDLPVCKQPDLALLLHYGGSAAAIILSISILLLAAAEMISKTRD